MPSPVEVLLSRYSPGIKHLAEPGPDDTQLPARVEVAPRAPDHGESMPFRFSVVRGDAAGFKAVASHQRGAPSAPS
ncbi:MAG: hypothetical protein P4L96_10030 [Rhodoferax sp.]|nr:hypothetical protein [Rhodoferax sp.]